MRRSASFLALVVFSTFVMVLPSRSSFAEPGFFHERNCQDKLVGNSYDCSLVFLVAGGSTIEKDCVEFTTDGVSQNFDWVTIVGLTVEAGCVCQTTGSSIKSFAVNASANAFECVGNTVSDLGNFIQFHGTIEGKKLHVQASFETGQSIVIECMKRSMACS
jgi:hypothetical protein